MGLCFCTPAKAETHVRNLNPPAKIAGLLGKPLGTRMIIDGRMADREMLANPLVVSEVDGLALKEPVSIEIRGKVQIQKGTRYRLEGYESGEFAGSPSWLAPGAQQPFQFNSVFVVTDEFPISSTPISMDNSPAAVAAAKERGAATATKNIKSGTLRILCFGQPWPVGKALVDDATGYRVQILAGCDMTEPFVAEVEAYNAAMRAFHASKVVTNQTPSASESGTMNGLPSLNDVFVIAVTPHSKDLKDYFTPESLLQALPKLVPAEVLLQVGEKWQSGVIVLKDKTVLFWRTCGDWFIAVDRAEGTFFYAMPKNGTPKPDAGGGRCCQTLYDEWHKVLRANLGLTEPNWFSTSGPKDSAAVVSQIESNKIATAYFLCKKITSEGKADYVDIWTDIWKGTSIAQNRP